MEDDSGPPSSSSGGQQSLAWEDRQDIALVGQKATLGYLPKRAKRPWSVAIPGDGIDDLRDNVRETKRYLSDVMSFGFQGLRVENSEVMLQLFSLVFASPVSETILHICKCFLYTGRPDR